MPDTPTREQLLSLFPVEISYALRLPGNHMADLSMAEQDLTRSMGERRIKSFSAGRAAAKDALAQAGISDFPVLIGDKRKPVWPDSVRGSISHCKDQCIAVVAASSAVSGIGVDVEQLKALGDGVQKLILTDTELTHIRSLEPSVEWGCVIFSIKESLFKCLNPITDNWIGFHDAEVTLIPGQLSCRISVSPAAHNSQTGAAELTARFLCTPSHVFSAVTLVQRQ